MCVSVYFIIIPTKSQYVVANAGTGGQQEVSSTDDAHTGSRKSELSQYINKVLHVCVFELRN